MHTISVSSHSHLHFPLHPQVVAFAGSRHGSLPDPVTEAVVNVFYAFDFTFLTGCASGIDGCFRRVLRHRPYTKRSMVACAFESRARRFDSRGLAEFAVVPDGLSPAAALHRRTVWMVRNCGLLVPFPADPVFGHWGKGINPRVPHGGLQLETRLRGVPRSAPTVAVVPDLPGFVVRHYFRFLGGSRGRPVR